MTRLFPWLMTLLLLLCGLGDRASAKALCPENIASRGFQGTAWECVLNIEPQAIESQWDETALQPGMALDVCNGPNVYTYVKQNPWTFYDPHGLNGFTDFIGGAWNQLGQEANTVVHGVPIAGIMLEIAAREVGNSVASTWGGSVDTDGAYDRLESVGKHMDSYGAEVKSATAEGVGADTGSGYYKAGGYTVIAAEVAAGGVQVVKSGKGVVTAFKEGFEEGSQALAQSARATAQASEATALEATAAENAAKGGAHGKVKGIEGNESHHMPADSVSPIPREKGPAISMEKMDHRKTASWGSSKEAKAYRAQQKELIEQGNFRDAQQMDIDDVRSKFGEKYDRQIQEMQDYTTELGH